MQSLTINGVEREFQNGIPKTLSDLLNALNLNKATVVAEINGRIIKRDNFADTALTSGQAIELVRLVGGG